MQNVDVRTWPVTTETAATFAPPYRTDVAELGKLEPAELWGIGKSLVASMFKKLQPITQHDFRERLSPLVGRIFLKQAIRKSRFAA